ncbi:MAG TPA: hypothetical protein PLR25_08130 [Planctomycetaceae bacterium]|nr:hypothetical protein [Planctomycetaceae bacterium]
MKSALTFSRKDRVPQPLVLNEPFVEALDPEPIDEARENATIDASEEDKQQAAALRIARYISVRSAGLGVRFQAQRADSMSAQGNALGNSSTR